MMALSCPQASDARTRPPQPNDMCGENWNYHSYWPLMKIEAPLGPEQVSLHLAAFFVLGLETAPTNSSQLPRPP